MNKVQLDQDSKNRLRLISDLLRVLDDTGNLTVGGVAQTNSILTDLITDFNAEDFATESTLLSILTSLQNGTEYEAKLVVDNAGDTWLEVRIWNTDAGTFDAPVYYSAGSNTVGTPAAPISYINPLTLLAAISNNTTGLATEVTLDSLLTAFNAENFSTEATLELVRLLLVSIDGKDFATQTTLAAVLAELQLKADLTETQPVSATSLPLPAGASTEGTLEAARVLLASLDTKDYATQTTLAALNSKDFATQTTLELVRLLLVALEGKNFATEATLSTLNGKDFATQTTLELVRLLLVALEGKDFATQTTLAAVDTKLAVATRTPNLLRTSGAGTIAPAVYDFSVYNAGDNDGTILGETIKSKEALNFSAGGMNHIYGAATISYDGTGTELVIIYNS